MNQLQVEMRPIAVLLPYVRNARTHSEAQIAQIAGSMVEFGWTNPILIDGGNGVIAGHGRLLAARQLGFSEVPVIELAHLTPNQKRAYILADNKLAENAGWDEELLRLELADLKLAEYDLGLMGFDPDELNDLLSPADGEQAGLTDDDAVPEVSENPISQRGDVWLLGEHRVLCGDATKAESYEALLGNKRVAMVWQDPPYNVDYANNAKDKMRGKNRPILNDNLGTDFFEFLKSALIPMMQRCDGAIYIAMSSSELDVLQAAFRSAGGKWSTFIIWAKNTFTLGRADYQRQYEPILYGWPEGAKKYWCGARDQGDVWNVKKPHKNDLHPTMKPVELVERAIRNSSRPGDLVLDCFGGSGSTLIAAEKTDRQAYLMELDPKYVDTIIRRWQEFTGKTASLQGDNRSFSAISNERSDGIVSVTTAT